MKHFIDINNFKKKEIDEIILLAKKIKKYPKKKKSGRIFFGSPAFFEIPLYSYIEIQLDAFHMTS